MAEGDNRAQYLNTTGISKAILGGVVKADPTAMSRTPEDAARATFYATAGQKDRLPEHKARRDTYPHITAANA